MRVLVSYDISDDRIRRQVTKVCEAHGQRVQRSVFECELTAGQLEALRERLDTARKGAGMKFEDSIRFYLLCEGCAAKVSVLGYSPVTAANAQQIVIG